MAQEKNWTRITVVWTALTFMAAAGFWLVWYLAAGEIPAVKEMLWSRGNEAEKTADVIYSLAFPLSRAWDAFLHPLFVFSFLCLWRYAKKKEAAGKPDVVFGLGVGFVSGLVGGLAFGLVVGLVVGFVFGLGYGLGVGLVVGFVFGLGYGAIVSLGFGAVIGWAVTLTVWLPLLALILLLMTGRWLVRSIRSVNVGVIRELLAGR